MSIPRPATAFFRERRRDILMIATVVLFPVLMLQFGLSVLVLRFADSSAVAAVALPQLIALALTAALLVASVRFVMAGLLPFVAALQTGASPTADDALKAFPHSLRNLPPRATAPTVSPVRLYGPLLAGYVIVVLLTVWTAGNELTIGMAFLEMAGLLAVAIVLTPPVAITNLMLSLGLIEAEDLEPEPAAAPDAAAELAAEDPAAATSVAPPPVGGAAPEPAAVDEPEVVPEPPASAPAPPPPPLPVPPAERDGGSVPPPA